MGRIGEDDEYSLNILSKKDDSIHMHSLVVLEGPKISSNTRDDLLWTNSLPCEISERTSTGKL